MQPPTQHPWLPGWQRLAGTWATEATHPAERPDTESVIFESTAPVGEGEAVYITATARAVRDDELEARCPKRSGPQPAHDGSAPDDLRGGTLQLYVARTRSCEVHVAAHHPVHGRGVHTRQPANPTSAR